MFKQKRSILLSMLIVFVLLTLFICPVEANDVVDIPGPNLEAAIRDEFNKPTVDITVTDMESLTFLYA